MTQVTERDLVQEFYDAQEEKRQIASKLTDAGKRLERARMRLAEYLESHDATETRSYEGLGSCSLATPKLRASYLKENEEEVFRFIQNQGREDMLKTNVHHSSLSSFVKELIESGIALPETIKTYFEPVIKFKPSK